MMTPRGEAGTAGPVIHGGGLLELVDTAWEKFVSGVPHEKLMARSPIIASWERCRDLRVDLSTAAAPRVGQDAIEALRHGNRQLLKAAADTLADATDTLVGSECLMLVTDAGGVVLDGVGDRTIRHAGIDIALGKGGIWGEVAAGTNGIGTTLATGHPMAVHAGEHYCERMKQWSCAAAPIRDPIDATVIGALNLSVRREAASAQLLALALMGAKQIEQKLTCWSAQIHARLLAFALDEAQHHRAEGVIAIDGKGRLAYASPAAQRQLSEHLQVRVPRLRRGRQLFGEPAGAANGISPGIPPEWITPVAFGGETCGHVMVIPPAASARRAVPSAPASARPKSGSSPFDTIVGEASSLRATIERARRIAPLDVPLLIEGETGTGKELFARALHESSRVAAGPFVTMNCGAISRELIASELFGYARGAFTGANPQGRPGRFEAANDGTLCLDEVGELPLDLQPYLLRVLEEGHVCRVGENRMREVKVRVIAMTNRDLRTEVEGGRFRRDLFHRLDVVSIELPPLRERDRDLERLIDHFIPLLAARHRRTPITFTPAARAALAAYSWPGNVRELRNLIERATLFAVDGVADISCLPRELSPGRPRAVEKHQDDIERIREAIVRSTGNISYACSILGMSRSTLYRRMARYGLSRALLKPALPQP